MRPKKPPSTFKLEGGSQYLLRKIFRCLILIDIACKVKIPTKIQYSVYFFTFKVII